MEKWRIFCLSVLIWLASLAVNKWYYQEGTNKLHFLKSRKPPLDNSLTSKACSSAWWWCGAVDGWDWYPPISCTVSALQRDSRQETWVVVYAQREYQNTSRSSSKKKEKQFSAHFHSELEGWPPIQCCRPTYVESDTRPMRGEKLMRANIYHQVGSPLSLFFIRTTLTFSGKTSRLELLFRLDNRPFVVYSSRS